MGTASYIIKVFYIKMGIQDYKNIMYAFVGRSTHHIFNYIFFLASILYKFGLFTT
jgi:hypothetical protein